MSNIRQYIGARYVFKIYENSADSSSAEWEQGVAYEALTIVTYLNSTYASKKDVPATVGDPASNPNYWIVTGAYNGQIATLQQQIDNINNVVVPAIVSDITNIESDITNIESVVDHLHTPLDWSNKKIVFLGDSYNFSSTDGWLAPLTSLLNIDSNNYYNYIVSGHAFNDGTWLSDITQFVSDNPSAVNDITDIVIVGGLNDATPAALTNIENSITTFLSYVRTNLPNAFVHVAFVGNALDDSSVLYDRTYVNRMTAYNYYCTSLNTDISRLLTGTYNALCQYTLFNSDGLHPNQYGNDRIAWNVAQGLQCGNANNIIVGADNQNISANGLFLGNVAIINDMTILSIASGSYITSGTTIPKIGSTPLSYQLAGTVSLRNTQQFEMIGFTTSNEYINILAEIKDGYLNLNSSMMSGNQYVDYTPTSTLRFMPVTITKPTACV